MIIFKRLSYQFFTFYFFERVNSNKNIIIFMENNKVKKDTYGTTCLYLNNDTKYRTYKLVCELKFIKSDVSTLSSFVNRLLEDYGVELYNTVLKEKGIEGGSND